MHIMTLEFITEYIAYLRSLADLAAAGRVDGQVAEGLNGIPLCLARAVLQHFDEARHSPRLGHRYLSTAAAKTSHHDSSHGILDCH